MAKAIKRTLPIPQASRVLCRRRMTTSATHATYAATQAARNHTKTVSCRVTPVSISNPTAARTAPMAILPLLPMWRM